MELHEKFTESLAGALDGEFEWITGGLDAHFEHGWEPYGPLVVTAMKAIASQAIDNAFVFDLENYGHSGSPIEEAMFCALVVAARQHADDVVLGPLQPAPLAPIVVRIVSQAEIGEYRADILLTATNRWSFGTSVGNAVEAHLVVECDGHDFHERTKEQASRDKRRDRDMQKAGYPVFRYPGSDIYADVFRCAEEALSAVLEAAEQARPKPPGDGVG
jgi:hypothetical protein